MLAKVAPQAVRIARTTYRISVGRDSGWRLLVVLLALYVFLVGISGLGSGFMLLGKELLHSFFVATANPFAGLAIGILATTLVQSSSVSTSMIVALVAAPGESLPLAHAIPMVMGANIGTTVTNTMASLAHISQRKEFLRAFAVATCHDFFNFIAVAILLPLELATGFLQHTATWVSTGLSEFQGTTYHSPIKGAIKAGATPLKALAATFVEQSAAQGAILIVLSMATIVGALYVIVRTMRSLMQSKVADWLGNAATQSSAPADGAATKDQDDDNQSHGAISGMALGAGATVLVQSSSITTSLLVPLAGAGLMSLKRAFPITLGANVGTTVTALLAALAVSGGHAQDGVRIALIHLMFNIVGIALLYPAPLMRRLPLGAAQWLANTAYRSRPWALFYLVGLFYALPALLVFLPRLWH